MKKLDLYLARQFLTIWVMALLGFICVFIIVDIIENLDDFIDNSVPFGIVLRYYFYYLPWFFNIGLPMSTLIATVFSIGLTAKRNELTAMKATGISLYRMSVPLILLGFLISCISFVFEDQFVIAGNASRSAIKQEYIKKAKKKKKDRRENIFLQRAEKYHIALGQYNFNTKIANSATVQVMELDKVFERIDLQQIAWVDSVESWSANQYSIRRFTPDGEEQEVIVATRDTLFNLGFVPADIERKSSSPDELNYRDLKEFIAQLEDNGVDTTRWEVVLNFKVSFAFTSLILVLFGIPLVLIKPKSGLTFGAGMSVLVIFAYYAFIKFGQSMGYKDLLDPWLSAWIGNMVFSTGGIILLISVRK